MFCMHSRRNYNTKVQFGEIFIKEITQFSWDLKKVKIVFFRQKREKVIQARKTSVCKKKSEDKTWAVWEMQQFWEWPETKVNTSN